ncbi:hypothetical protein G6F70_003558 [Rhizopus microsporus]|nr:hypothetical protein G6F71_005193 [Rhizopus microsporus]KAG1200974.1 hypothetical protein G6F70_003558 [Rhizopus microsporus]KAG1213524.1 hypothetical protein G6F69_002759 [Rhizopus microsporus]KAG1232599.1 hypothetical protein G6F67_004885 [Rhizopus microsporus]KAG1265621.1 hypothetical protein G6F68_003434 [Rhizopus microsporus]
MSSTSTISNDAISQSNEYRQPKQIENLSPLAVGDQKLRRHLGYFSGTMMNVGQIIGTGIFSNPAFILLHSGSGGMMLILWVVGALFAATGVWNYLELGTMLPRSGGEQEYLAYEFPNPKKLVAFVFIILVGVFGRGSGLAQGSTVFGNNIIFAIGGPNYVNNWGSRGFGVFCLTFWLVLNITSAKLAIRANNFFTVLKIALLVLLICVGFAGFAGRLPNRPDLAENFSFHGTSNNPGSYATAIYYVIYAYGGWFNLNYVLDELKDPIKNLPKCAISALSLTTVLYILANIAYLAVLPAAVIKSSKLTVAANLFNTALGGVFGGRVLPVLVGMSSFGFVGVIFYSGSRIVLEAARTGFLPFDRFFSKLHPKLQTPIPALVLLYVIAMIFLLAPPPGTVFQFIVAFSGYGQYFFVGLSVVGLLILRRTQPDVKRPIKAPFVFVFIPPDSPPSGYPYWLPYVVTIILALCSVGLWYYKLVYKDALATSYNAEIQKDGKQELFEDVYETYGSFKTTSSDTLDKVVVHEVSHKS